VTSAVVGVILNLSIVFGLAVFSGTSGINWFGVILAAASFTALYFFKVDVLLVVVAGGLIGLAKYLVLS
jgi:chromate transporter